MDYNPLPPEVMNNPCPYYTYVRAHAPPIGLFGRAHSDILKEEQIESATSPTGQEKIIEKESLFVGF